MTTLVEIKEAVRRLSDTDLNQVELLVQQEKPHRTVPGSHSVLGIPPISLGPCHENGPTATGGDFETRLRQSIGQGQKGTSTDQILEETRGEY